MRLFIPTIGTHLILRKEWQFRLFFESRNEKLIVKMKIKPPPARNTNGKVITGSHPHYYWRGDQCVLAMLSKGTRIKVDRIYIRKGGKSFQNFDSVTFWVKSGPYKGARFWAKLMDVNLIECDVDESTIPESYREGAEFLLGGKGVEGT